jgi:DNA invertase Pin-like site-specific DNA recombinase
MTENYTVYIRRSTEKQEDKHQHEDIREWLNERDLSIGEVEVLSEQASGSSSSRDEFRTLINHIKTGNIDYVVVWEISRIARKGKLAQEFFDACENNGTTVHITNGSISEIQPDGTNRLIADIISAVAAEERRSLIRRTKSGVSRAQSEGKWLGNVPLGFRRDGEGYLQPIIDADREEGEVSYIEVQEALQRVKNGESYNSVAKSLPITRQGLSKIHQDEERRAWYIDGDADDERVQSAIDSVSESNTEMRFFDSPEPILPDDYFELFNEYDHTPDSEDEVDPFPYSIQYPSDVEIEVEWFAEKMLCFVHESYRYTVYYAPKDTQKNDDWIARRMSTEQGVRAVQRQDYDEELERYGTVEDALERFVELVLFDFDWE